MPKEAALAAQQNHQDQSSHKTPKASKRSQRSKVVNDIVRVKLDGSESLAVSGTKMDVVKDPNRCVLCVSTAVQRLPWIYKPLLPTLPPQPSSIITLPISLLSIYTPSLSLPSSSLSSSFFPSSFFSFFPSFFLLLFSLPFSPPPPSSPPPYSLFPPPSPPVNSFLPQSSVDPCASQAESASVHYPVSPLSRVPESNTARRRKGQQKRGKGKN